MIILVRPEQSLPRSLQRFQKEGYNSVGLALQRIGYETDAIQTFRDTYAQSRVPCAKAPDKLIVTSQYAAEGLGMAIHMESNEGYWADTQIIAIGETTAKVLAQFIEKSKIITPTQQNSEGLLKLPILSAVKHQHVAIFKGKNGRTQLAEALTERGARVEEVCVYARHPIPMDFNAVKTRLNCGSTPVILIITNGEAAQIILDAPDAAFLREATWLVISDRIAKLVKQRGIKSVLISAGASDDALVQCIQQNTE